MRPLFVFCACVFICLTFSIGAVNAQACSTCPNQGDCVKLPTALTVPPLAPIAARADGKCAVPLPPKRKAKVERSLKTGRRGPRRLLQRVRSWRRVRGECCQ